MKKIILFFIIIIILFLAFRKLDSRSFTAEELGIEELSSSFDADGDGRTWEQGYLYGSMQYNNNVVMSSTPSDDWLISHDFELEAGKNYKGTFSVRASIPST